MDGPVCLIVNPHAGGGRALRLLPGVEAALRGQGRPFRVERDDVDASTPASWPARRATAGEIVAAMGGDGIVGAVAGELRDGEGLLAVLPGGRGNDFARKLGIPFDPVEAAKLLQTGAGARGRPRRGRRHDATSASSARASTPTSTGSRSRRA